MKYNEYQNIEKILSGGKKIVLTAHANPDGDTIGSNLALYHFLKQRGHHVHFISPNQAPGFLQWLPGYDQTVVFDNHPERAKALIAEADVVCAVDYNAFHRTGDKMEKLLAKSKAVKLMIDHHPNPDEVFRWKISDTMASSTAELVFRFFEDINQLDAINQSVAACLYVGLLTDTGSFSYSIKSDKPYLMAAFLYNTGADLQAINQRIYSAFTESRLRLTGFAISEKLKIVPEFRLAYISLTKEELDRFNHQTGDTEGLVNYALSIENIVVAILLTERDNLIRLSFRSKGNFAVNQIANTYFEGGGHKNAAGGNSFVSMGETIQKLLEVFPEFKTQIDAVQL